MNPTAVVTGGSRGIGKAIVEKLVLSGYQVFFTYKNSTEEANKLTDRYPALCKSYQVDHLDRQAIKTFCEIVLSLNAPSILINSVGINNDAIFFNQEFDEFWRVLELNFGAPAYISKMFLPSMMKNRNGHIINISSVAANKPKIGNSAYGVSKLALERFSKSLALETARFNIRVNCVAPGFVDTDMLKQYLANEKIKNDFYKQIPMRKTLSANDIANVVYELCENKLISTGSVISVGHGENII